MVEIIPNLFIGNQEDYERRVRGKSGWSVVHACKEPYHRQALGYTGRAALKTHPEYLIARRRGRLILNLIDPDDPKYIPKQIIDAALEFIHKSISDGRRVLVQCNQGESRSPSIGLLYIVAHTDIIKASDFFKAEVEFRAIYPAYRPSPGIRGFVRSHFSIYRDQRLKGVRT